MITQEKGKWVLRARTTGKVLGIFESREQAQAQERAIEEAKSDGDTVRVDEVARFERYDFRATDLARPETTQDGYWKLEGKVARTGIQVYRDAAGGMHKEMRFEDDVKKSLDGFALVPLTNGHPPGLVSPDNAKQHIAGAIGQAEYADGWVKAPITVWTQDAIDSIKRGKVQLSVGYTCRVVHKPGTHEGEHYDAMQTEIRVNHVALVDRARAGDQARLRLDDGAACTSDFLIDEEAMVASSPDTTDAHRETPLMHIMKIDGLDVKVESVNDASIIERALAKAREDGAGSAATERQRADAAEAAKAAAEKRATELQAKADGLEADSKRDVKCDECMGSGKVDGEACSMCSGKGAMKGDSITFEARVASRARSDARAARIAGAARAKLLAEAGSVLGANEKLDDKDDLSIKKLVIKKLDKDVVLDGKDAVYIDHRYGFEMEKRGKTQLSPIEKVRLVADGADAPTGDDVDPKHKMHRNDDDAVSAYWNAK